MPLSSLDLQNILNLVLNVNGNVCVCVKARILCT